MTEKEFLIKFLSFVEANYNSTQVAYSFSDELSDCFLDEHHKEYYEVEFVRIEDFDKKAEKLLEAWSPILAENMARKKGLEFMTKEMEKKKDD